MSPLYLLWSMEKFSLSKRQKKKKITTNKRKTRKSFYLNQFILCGNILRAERKKINTTKKNEITNTTKSKPMNVNRSVYTVS